MAIGDSTPLPSLEVGGKEGRGGGISERVNLLVTWLVPLATSPFLRAF